MAAQKSSPAAAETAHEALQNHPPPDDCPNNATARPPQQRTDAAESDVWPFESVGTIACRVIARLALALDHPDPELESAKPQRGVEP